MTGCVVLRKNVYYIRLTYYDRRHVRKEKCDFTGCDQDLPQSGEHGAPVRHTHRRDQETDDKEREEQL